MPTFVPSSCEMIIFLRTDSEVAVALTDHLKKYLMFSKTQITTSELSVWACKTSDTAGQTITESLITLGDGGFTEVWSQSEPTMAEVADVNSFHANRLQWGEARLFKPTIGKYLPQDLNYDVKGRVDFDKGCYTGQEIIARLHYRGEPKRRLRLLSVSEGIQPALGEKVVNSDGRTLAALLITQCQMVNAYVSVSWCSILTNSRLTFAKVLRVRASFNTSNPATIG